MCKTNLTYLQVKTENVVIVYTGVVVVKMQKYVQKVDLYSGIKFRKTERQNSV